MTKQLTQAQKAELARLNAELLTAQGSFARFVAYLRDEHSAPEGEYTITDIAEGFVPVEKDSGPAL